MKKLEMVFYGPKSLCTCGHLGDGEDSDHTDQFTAGHGMCRIEGCSCNKFTWASWAEPFLEFIHDHKLAANRK